MMAKTRGLNIGGFLMGPKMVWFFDNYYAISNIRIIKKEVKWMELSSQASNLFWKEDT